MTWGVALDDIERTSRRRTQAKTLCPRVAPRQIRVNCDSASQITTPVTCGNVFKNTVEVGSNPLALRMSHDASNAPSTGFGAHCAPLATVASPTTSPLGRNWGAKPQIRVCREDVEAPLNPFDLRKYLERVTGIEPAWPAWKAGQKSSPAWPDPLK